MSQTPVFPALFATFYYSNDQKKRRWYQKKQPRFLYHVVRTLGLRVVGNEEDKIWEGKDQQAQISFNLRCFVPRVPYAKDVTVVQLVMSHIREDREASQQWPEMRQCLERVMNDKTVGDIFGYTLIYQAVIPDSAPLTLFERQTLFLQMDLTPFLPETGRPRLPANLTPLETTSVLNGRGQVWLLNMPNIQGPQRGNQLEKGSVYLALCFKSANDDLIARVLFEQGADLFIPELIAHKAYNQIRQYRLADKQEAISHQITSLTYNTKQQLKNVEAIAKFDRLRISLARQRVNYERKTTPLTNNAIIAYHATQMDAAQQELDFIVEEGHSILQATDIAIAIQQTRIEWYIGIIFGLLGIGLAIAQFVDAELATAWFTSLGHIEPDGGFHRFDTFLGQLIITGVIFAVVVAVFAAIWLLRWLLGWLWAGLRGLKRWVVG